VSLELLFAGAGTPPAPAPAPSLTPAPGLRVLATLSGTTETDVTADVLSLTITRGRARERETMAPGRCQIELWNFRGDYDPDNVSSPLYPNIRPNKLIRVVADVLTTGTPFTWGSSGLGGGLAFGAGAAKEIALFTGRLEGGAFTYDEGGLQPKVIWNAIDASKRLNRDRSTTGYGTAGDLTGERVAAVLDGTTPTWPATERELAPGTRTVQAETGDAGRYDYMVQVAASEFGAFFISKEGWAVFRDSTWTPAPAIPILGYGVGEHPFSRIATVDDEAEIYNAVTVSAPGLVDQVAEDTGSQVEFGRSDLPVPTILDSTGDMSDVATTLIEAYSSPRRRISSLRIDRIATDWSFILSRELQDRVIVRHRPIYGGLFEQLSVIQGIQIEVEDSENWAVTWNLAPPIDVVSNPNLLTANQSSIETDASGWAVSFTGIPSGNGIVIDGRVAGPYGALVGGFGLEVRTFGIAQIQGGIRTTPYTTAPVVVGETYRASAWTRDAGWLSEWWYVVLNFHNSGGTIVQSYTSGAFGGYFTHSNEWQQGSIEGVAPASAAYATVELTVVENDNGGHIYFVDSVELRHVGA
jgi:hypothetical protein